MAGLGKIARCGRHQYWPQWTALASLTIGLLALVTIDGSQSRSDLKTLREPVTPRTALTGNVRGPESIAALEGRVVDVVNIETNERERSTTNHTGTFVFKVKPGKYRVELSLRDGESLVRSPGVMDVSRSGDSHADFIVGARPVARPRGPAYRTSDGLGDPIG